MIQIEYLMIFALLLCAILLYFNHKRNMELLRSVSSPDRGTPSERRLIIKMLKKKVHPQAIFHDLYLKKQDGSYSQIDLVVAMPQGLISIEVKDYSGWLFGNENQRYWTQVLNYGKEKYRFYNPIMQNAGHIKTLREQSEQFASLPIYNIVLFTGNCTLKKIDYSAHHTYVGYMNDISPILKHISHLPSAEYSNKQEVARILHQGVKNGKDPLIVSEHISKVAELSAHQPEPKINYGSSFLRFSIRRHYRRY